MGGKDKGKEYQDSAASYVAVLKDVLTHTRDQVAYQLKKKTATSRDNPYIHLATNSFYQILSDPKGARCVACLGSPNITREAELIDNTTVLCPQCYVDAVVPASEVPDETTLREWQRIGFGGESQLQHLLPKDAQQSNEIDSFAFTKEQGK